MKTSKFEELKQNLEMAVNTYNTAVEENNAHYVASTKEKMKDAVSDLAEQAMADLCAECASAEHPMLEFLKHDKVDTFKAKIDSETRKASVESAGVPVDLVYAWKYFFNSKPMHFRARAEIVSMVITFKVGTDIGKDIERLRYKLTKPARELIGDNANPKSITSECKLLQAAIDEIVFVDDGTGKNKIRCNGQDVKVLSYWMTSHGKDHSVRVASGATVVKYIGEIIYRIANDYSWDLNSKKIIEEPAPVKKASGDDGKVA